MTQSIRIIREGKRLHIIREDLVLDILTFHKFGLELKQILESDQGFFIIYDASTVKTEVPGEVKLAMSQWLVDNEELLKVSLNLAVVIVPSFISQLVVKAVLSIKNPKVNYKICASPECAKEYIDKIELVS